MPKNKKQKLAPPQGLITTPQFAALADVVPTSVTGWVKHKLLPFAPVSERPRLWDEATVKAWVKGGKKRAMPEGDAK